MHALPCEDGTFCAFCREQFALGSLCGPLAGSRAAAPLRLLATQRRAPCDSLRSSLLDSLRNSLLNSLRNSLLNSLDRLFNYRKSALNGYGMLMSIAKYQQ